MSMLAQMTDFTTIFEKILEDLGGKYQKNLYFRFQDKTINLGYLRKKNGQWSHYDLIKKESDFKMRKIGDYNYLVFDEGLYEKCKESIPEYFGIYVCNYSTWKSQSGQSLKVGKIEKMRSASKVEGFLSNLKLDWKDFSYIEISASIAHRIEGERNENEFWPAIEKNYDKNKSLNEIKQAFYAKKAVDYTPVCKILMEHQKVGAAIAERYNKFGFFFDTGTGKTLTALEIIKKKQNESGARFMIVCPKAIINTAWMDDCEQFFPDMKLLPLLKGVNVEYYIDLYHKWKRKGLINDSFVDIYFSDLKFITLERAKEVLSRCADHYIVNPESFRISHEKFMNICGVDNEGNKKEINGLIVDESSLIRNTKSKLFQSIEYQSLKMEYVYLLSGKPAPNKTKEYLSQLRILSDELYYKCQYDIRKTSKLRYDYEKKIAEIILENVEKISLTISKEDCLELPDTVLLVRNIEMPSKAVNIYQNIKKHEWEIVKKAEESGKTKNYIAVYLKGSAMKLRQVANGIINTSERNEKPQYKEVHNAKLHELLNVIQELGEKQAIIWAQFKYDIYRISKTLQKHGYSVATAYSETIDVDQSVHDFKSGKVQFLVANPKTLQFGVTLVNCSYAIYYSISYSYEEYYQSHDRIYRKGQTKSCTYIFLNAVGTIDELMYKVVMDKEAAADINELILKHFAEENDI